MVERYEPDDVVLRLPFRDDVTNNGRTYHGGVVVAALDTSGALAAWSNHDFDLSGRAVTLSLLVQYVGTASGSDLLCRGRTVRRARELVFPEIDATDVDGRMLAVALQTSRIS